MNVSLFLAIGEKYFGSQSVTNLVSNIEQLLCPADFVFILI